MARTLDEKPREPIGKAWPADFSRFGNENSKAGSVRGRTVVATLNPKDKMKKAISNALATMCAVWCIASQACAAVVNGPIVNPANGHNYYLLSANTWTAAEAESLTLGGHLATINNLAENEFVFNNFGMTGQYGLWIGLNDLANEGSFVWSSGEPFTYSNWAPGQPDNNNAVSEDFVMMFVEQEGQVAPGVRKWNDFINTPFEHDTFGGALQGVVEVVPEPSTWALLLSGCFLFWFYERRKAWPNKIGR